MPRSSQARIDLALLVILLFGQLLLMAGSLRGSEGDNALETGLVRASRPVVGVARVISGGFAGLFDSWEEIRTARRENVRLRSEVEREKGEIERYREQAIENRRLRRLLGMREDLAPKSIAASVVTTKLSTQTRMIVIDRGSESGVRVDQGVVAWGGAVGRVVSADRGFAKVRLISDPNSGVAGVVQRSRAAGMVLGRGDGSLEMLYVPKYEDVAVGDRVVTSGLDGVYPRGFGVGEVTVVEDTAGVSKGIRLAPEVDFRSLEEVLVLVEPTGAALLEPPDLGGPP